jgi:hypothetical protein
LEDTLALQVTKGEKKPHVDQGKAQASLQALAAVAAQLKEAYWAKDPASPGATNEQKNKTAAEQNLTKIYVGLDSSTAKGIVDKVASASKTGTSSLDIGTMVGNAIVTIYKGVVGAKQAQRQEIATRLELGKWPDFGTVVNPTGKTQTTIEPTKKTKSSTN